MMKCKECGTEFINEELEVYSPEDYLTFCCDGCLDTYYEKCTCGQNMDLPEYAESHRIFTFGHPASTHTQEGADKHLGYSCGVEECCASGSEREVWRIRGEIVVKVLEGNDAGEWLVCGGPEIKGPDGYDWFCRRREAEDPCSEEYLEEIG